MLLFIPHQHEQLQNKKKDRVVGPEHGLRQEVYITIPD